MFETQVTEPNTRPSAFIPQDRKCLSRSRKKGPGQRYVLGIRLDAVWYSEDKSEQLID